MTATTATDLTITVSHTISRNRFAKVVSIIKTQTGAKYDGSDKTWTLPAGSKQATVDYYLAPMVRAGEITMVEA